MNNLDDFIDEVKFVSDDEFKPLVRYSTEVGTESDNGFDVYFFAGFCTEDDAICETEVYCGKNLNAKYIEGSRKADELVGQIKEACNAIGVSVRPGRYEAD